MKFKFDENREDIESHRWFFLVLILVENDVNPSFVSNLWPAGIICRGKFLEDVVEVPFFKPMNFRFLFLDSRKEKGKKTLTARN